MEGTERYGIRVDKQYFNFCSAHFLIFADGTREELHGHNYHVSVEAEGSLDAGNLVLDFIHFKPLVKRICDRLDHRTILPGLNPDLSMEEEGSNLRVRFGGDVFTFPLRDVTILPLPNTSTECLARYVANQILEHLHPLFPDSHIVRLRVSVSESPGQAGWYECYPGPGDHSRGGRSTGGGCA